MLNKRLRELRDFTQQRLFKKYRHDWTFDFVGEFKGKNLSLEKRAALAFKISCEALEPIVFPDEKISFVRTVNNVPAYYEPKELVGKTCIAIVNLPPRPMMGIDSCGMLISAVHHEEGEEKLHLLMVDDHIPAGAKLY